MMRDLARQILGCGQCKLHKRRVCRSRRRQGTLIFHSLTQEEVHPVALELRTVVRSTVAHLSPDGVLGQAQQDGKATLHLTKRTADNGSYVRRSRLEANSRPQPPLWVAGGIFQIQVSHEKTAIMVTVFQRAQASSGSVTSDAWPPSVKLLPPDCEAFILRY